MTIVEKAQPHKNELQQERIYILYAVEDGRNPHVSSTFVQKMVMGGIM